MYQPQLNIIKDFIKLDSNEPVEVQLTDELSIKIYPFSIIKLKANLFFIAKENDAKYLFIVVNDHAELSGNIHGCRVDLSDSKECEYIMKCELNTYNRKQIQKLFPSTRPHSLGKVNSFGFGDRIGLANAAHLRSLKGSHFQPILAQQSIRELTRTQRKPDEVMDAAVWAVFQEGYDKPWGSDADHVKTYGDIDLMIDAGFNMFTFDPSDYVDNEADNYSRDQLNQRLQDIQWSDFKDELSSIKERYTNSLIKITDEYTIQSTEESLKRALVKYGNAIIHIENLHSYLSINYSNHDFEIEISVDETDSVTSPFEHYFISNELTRLGVKFVSLAPRFIGDFEKGIDYKGDISLFKSEYKKHIAIAKYFGGYKISLHSGSDKFSVYNAIAENQSVAAHIKTAGTTYLEALRVVAVMEPNLFREILNLSCELFRKEKDTYHVSANIENIKAVNEYSDEELINLFKLNDARQILHVAFGKILTEKKDDGEYRFKSKILKCLEQNEETHYKFLINHFRNHLSPFNQSE